jgi:hypothetical protein
MLEITPVNLEQANAFVAALHRHHRPVPGAKFSVAVSDDQGVVRGVAIVGRPVSRRLDDGWTLEVNRCCTDGARNACSMLYGAAWKAAKAMGFRRIVTYTLPEEGGASLRGAGWVPTFGLGGIKNAWNVPSRGRIGNAHTDKREKVRWEASISIPDHAPPQIQAAEIRHGQCGFDF